MGSHYNLDLRRGDPLCVGHERLSATLRRPDQALVGLQVRLPELIALCPNQALVGLQAQRQAAHLLSLTPG